MALAARALLLGLMALSAASVAGRARKPSGSSRGTGSTPAGRAAGPRAPPDRATLLALRPLIERADQLDQAERKPEAVEKYREALALWPDFEMGHFNLALCLQESGRLLEAHSHFSRTLALLPPDPSGAEEVDKRADVLSRFGQLSATLAVGGPGGNGAGTSGVPLSEEQSKALRGAAKLLREAVRLNPQDAPSRLALGQMLSARGRGEEATDQLRQSAALQAQSPMALLELALALHRHGSADDAAELQATLGKALAMADPPKGVAAGVGAEFHAQLGMALRREIPHAARGHFERALDLDAKHATASTSYYHLGSILRQSGEPAAERQLYEAAVRQSVWRRVDQRPGYLAGPAGAVDVGPWPKPADWPVLARSIALLETGFPQIKAELLASLAGTEWSAGVPDKVADVEPAGGSQQEWGAPDLEGLTTGDGAWQQTIYHRNGLRAVGTGFDRLFPETTRIVSEIEALAGGGLPKGSVEFSLLSAGTLIRPHCGPTNHKWRMHLGVLIPPGEAASIRVGGLGNGDTEEDGDGLQRRRAWEEGKVLLFDDSFEHEVANDSDDAARVVLIVDVWHPLVTEKGQRDQVRRDFGWHTGALAA